MEMRRIAWCLVALGWLAEPPGVGAQSCPDDFAAARSFELGVAPLGLVVEDLDLDGKVDVAAVGWGQVTALLGNGDGTFRPSATVSGFTKGTGIAAALLDADALPDLVIVDESQGVGVLIGDGAGGFQPALFFSVPSKPSDVTVGDLDGDGAPDVVTAGSAVSVLLGNGDGTLRPAQDFPAGIGPISPVIADIDRDGNLDVLVANSHGASISLLLGNGDGTLRAPVDYAVAGGPERIVVAHLDGDPYLDVAVAFGGYSNWEIDVLIGTATGSFLPRAVFPVPDVAQGLCAADVDGDGSLDLLLTFLGSDSLAVMHGLGDGTFVAGETAAVGGQPVAVAAADVDRDGRVDALVANESPRTVAVVRGRGDGTFVSATRTLLTDDDDAVGMAIADYDADGIPDAALARRGWERVTVMLGNGDGTFQEGPVRAVAFDPTGAETADLDGDGRPDLILPDPGGNEVVVLLGTGGGDFASSLFVPAGEAPFAVRAGRIDTDPIPDLLTLNSDQTFRVLIGRGDGWFEAPRQTGIGGQAQDAVLGDLDGDGDGDVAIARRYFDDVAVFLGNGDGTFQTATLYPTIAELYAIAAADVDADGDLDLAVGGDDRPSGPGLAILLGAGDGTFVPGPTYAARSRALRLGDLTGDGVVDVAVLNPSGLAILEGHGDGAFEPPAIYSVGDWTPMLALVDLDADGGLDALMAESSYSAALLTAVLGDGLTIRPPALPPGTIGASYQTTLLGSRGAPPYSFALAGGALPAGVTLAASGAITGTPAVAGAFAFLAEVRDAQGCVAHKRYVLTIGRGVDFLVGQGLGAPNPNRVRLYSPSGAATSVDFLAYAAGHWGVNVAAAELDGGARDEILTGPGPGDVYGPQVRGFRRDGSPMGPASFYAYGTLRFGVNVAGGDLDGDGFGEILTGAGPGDVFGPHVRAFDFDATTVSPIGAVNVFAYSTLRYGVNVAAADVDGDLLAEIATGAGPGEIFPAHVRGFDYDGTTLRALEKVNFTAFGLPGFGVGVAGGDADADGYAELGAAPGPGPAHPSEYQGFDYDGAAVVAIPGFSVTRTPTLYGGRIGFGDVSMDLGDDLLTGLGRDPSAPSDVASYRFESGSLVAHANAFTPFPDGYGVNVTAGALEP